MDTATMKIATIVSDQQGQTVHLPSDVRLEAEEVYVKQIGPSVILIPKHYNTWESLAESLNQFSDDYMHDRAQPAQQSRPGVFE
jgi:antitoxin VapB